MSRVQECSQRERRRAWVLPLAALAVLFVYFQRAR